MTMTCYGLWWNDHILLLFVVPLNEFSELHQPLHLSVVLGADNVIVC